MRQKTKIFSTSLVFIFGVILLSGAGCASKPSILSGQLTTEGKCVELTAHALVGYQYGQRTDMASVVALQKKLDDLKKQYGWSDTDITKNCEIFAEQKDFMEQLAKRTQELSAEIK